VANKCDVCFYVLQLAGGVYVLLLLYVDDIILAATTAALAKHYVDIISKRFRISCEGKKAYDTDKSFTISVRYTLPSFVYGTI
jgi:hypothetical protein